jgi:hypothetical protein
MAGEVYDEDGEREATFHIACDMGLITGQDLVNTSRRRTKIKNG